MKHLVIFISLLIFASCSTKDDELNDEIIQTKLEIIIPEYINDNFTGERPDESINYKSISFSKFETKKGKLENFVIYTEIVKSYEETKDDRRLMRINFLKKNITPEVYTIVHRWSSDTFGDITSEIVVNSDFKILGFEDHPYWFTNLD